MGWKMIIWHTTFREYRKEYENPRYVPRVGEIVIMKMEPYPIVRAVTYDYEKKEILVTVD